MSKKNRGEDVSCPNVQSCLLLKLSKEIDLQGISIKADSITFLLNQYVDSEDFKTANKDFNRKVITDVAYTLRNLIKLQDILKRYNLTNP